MEISIRKARRLIESLEGKTTVIEIGDGIWAVRADFHGTPLADFLEKTTETEFLEFMIVEDGHGFFLSAVDEHIETLRIAEDFFREGKISLETYAEAVKTLGRLISVRSALTASEEEF